MCLLQTFNKPNSEDKIQYDNNNNKFQTLCFSLHNMASTSQIMLAQSLYQDLKYKMRHTFHVV